MLPVCETGSMVLVNHLRAATLGEFDMVAMTREEADAIVNQHVFQVDQYQAVRREQAMAIIGDVRYERLCNDRVRNLGPNDETLYPWNVSDYLVHPELNQ